jgi:hypothetical protein
VASILLWMRILDTLELTVLSSHSSLTLNAGGGGGGGGGGRDLWLDRCCCTDALSSLSRRLLDDSPTWTSTDVATDAQVGLLVGSWSWAPSISSCSRRVLSSCSCLLACGSVQKIER